MIAYDESPESCTTMQAVVLPIPSYSIKVVEHQAGYKRTLEESGGQWSMAQYIPKPDIESHEDTAGD